MERLKILTGSITKTRSEAVIYLANTVLMGGEDVSNDILVRAVDSVTEKTDNSQLVVMLKSKSVPGQQIFYVNGPLGEERKGKEGKILANCYRTCFERAQYEGIESLDILAIPSDHYDSQLFQVATILLRETIGFLKKCSTIKKIQIVCQDERTAKIYMQAYNFWFAPTKESKMIFQQEDEQ